MRKHSKKCLITFVAVTLLGACLHFVYAIFPNPVVAIFSPINESLWEHLKILFWPYLLGFLYLTRGGEQGCRIPWMLSALALCAVMLAVSYVYHILLLGEALAVDVALYVLLMAAGFLLLPGLFQAAAGRRGLREAVTLAFLTLGALLVLFTFLPPDQVLFADLSGVNTFATIPY